tara:strand:+ start:1266 stop:2795 length:1530 start_codon:yes stop_codon:yes gene_type:complete
MCSICGIINGGENASLITKKMIDIQKHRAPDDCGIFSDDDVHLGMGRLEIIDLESPGLCPYKEDSVVLCYNGEIFNYIELRIELQKKDWKFKTNSDIEVLLKAWREWGTDMFDRLNGMFSFAIYNKNIKQLVLARDIAGEKPLYYYHKGKKFLFASEAKALSGVLNLEVQSDDYFDTFQHCLFSTLWKDVVALAPAHYLILDITTNKKKVVEYWNFEPYKIDLKSADEELEYLIQDAVKLRVQSDVPVGLYYSGGIDSSLIDAVHNFDNKFYFDDSKNWKNDFFNEIKLIVQHLDFPVGSLSSFPLWKLAQEASKKVKVVLSGEGADEIFGGYVRYLPISQEWELKNKYSSYEYIFGKYYPPYLDGFSKITARNDNVEFVKEQFSPYFDMFSDPINAMGFADFKVILPSLLQMGDRMASAFGLENRCPFLDKRIIEFGFSLPSDQKIKDLNQKIILRKILKKHGLDTPLRNEKKGLTIRFNQWFGQYDWDRSTYFSLLLDNWNQIFNSS